MRDLSSATVTNPPASTERILELALSGPSNEFNFVRSVGAVAKSPLKVRFGSMIKISAVTPLEWCPHRFPCLAQ